jgi:hypothetical protein
MIFETIFSLQRRLRTRKECNVSLKTLYMKLDTRSLNARSCAEADSQGLTCANATVANLGGDQDFDC